MNKIIFIVAILVSIIEVAYSLECRHQACRPDPTTTQKTTTTQSTQEITTTQSTQEFTTIQSTQEITTTQSLPTKSSKYDVDDVEKLNQLMQVCSALKTCNVGNRDCKIFNIGSY